MGNCLPLSLKFLNSVIVRYNFTKHREEMYLSDGIACAAPFLRLPVVASEEPAFSSHQIDKFQRQKLEKKSVKRTQ